MHVTYSRGRDQHHCLWLLGRRVCGLVLLGSRGSAVPSVVPPALAAPAAETVDAAALSFLLAQSLAAQQHEEVEVKEAAELAELEEKVAVAEGRLLAELQREREEATHITRRTWAALSRVEQYAVLWSSAKEKVHHALRGPTRPPSGTRPGRLAEPVPQGFWPDAPRQPGPGAPLVAPPVLAAPAADGIDASALRFLTAAAALRLREQEGK